MPSYRCIFKLQSNPVNKRLLKVLSNCGNDINGGTARYHLASLNHTEHLSINLTANRNKKYHLCSRNEFPTTWSRSCNVQRNFSTSLFNYNAISVDTAGKVGFLNETSVGAITSLNDDSTALIDDLPKVVETLEPTFTSIGLGGYTPVGFVQSGMEYLHVTCGMPWWGCVVCGTILIRISVLPLVIKFQKSMSDMNVALPELQQLQMRLMRARNNGDLVEAARLTSEMTDFVRTRDINPLKSMTIPLIQMPVFLSFFFALRGMAEKPVESLHDGGAAWFTDLTVPDPYYVLPVVTCATLLLTVELGLDTGVSIQQVQFKALKYVMRIMPFLMVPVMINFPGIILVYWMTTNAVSLVQMQVLRAPKVRDFLGYAKPVQTPQMNTQADENVGFKEGFRESLTNLKLSHEMMEREMLEKEEIARKEREVHVLEARLRKLKEDLKTNKE